MVLAGLLRILLPPDQNPYSKGLKFEKEMLTKSLLVRMLQNANYTNADTNVGNDNVKTTVATRIMMTTKTLPRRRYENGYDDDKG